MAQSLRAACTATSMPSTGAAPDFVVQLDERCFWKMLPFKVRRNSGCHQLRGEECGAGEETNVQVPHGA